MHEFGNKVSKMLAHSICKKQTHTYIQKITCSNQGSVFISEQIAKNFYNHYSSLYDLSSTREEIMDVIKKLPLSKSPDGFTGLFSKPFKSNCLLYY